MMNMCNSCSNTTHNNINKQNGIKLNKKNCIIITFCIFFVFFLSTLNNLFKYIHIKTSRYILTYSNILYLISFLSLNKQVELLIGLDDGILPIDEYINDLKKVLKRIEFFFVRRLVYWVYKLWEYAIRNRIKVKTFCKVGILLSVLNFLIQKNIQNDLIRIVCSFYLFPLLFILHISFKIVMRDFMVFQCDLLMNEFGFLLTFLNLSDSYYLIYSNTLIICLLRLVCFKILFNSGVHKFVYEGSQWLHLKGCENLFLCQPLPSILSHIAYCKFDKSLICFLIIISEVLSSWLIFCSSKLRILFYIIFINIHISCHIICNKIFLSYIFIILFFSSFDDSILNLFSTSGNVPDLYKNNGLVNLSIYLIVCLINIIISLFYLIFVFINFVPFLEKWDILDFQPFRNAYKLYYYFWPLNICNSYAMLTSTTKCRQEIIIEELHKIGNEYKWKYVNFNYKPGNINKIGSILWWGHIPRLEWKFYYFANSTEYNKKGTYPIYICSFLKKLYNREKGMISMFKEKHIQAVPLMIKLNLHDYKMNIKGCREMDDIPMKSFPPQECKPWECGKYWKRREVRVLETLKCRENKTN
ncbi:lipase maturation factor, putative [Plasmodium chabaudi chabaudi]|uniref:Lipase maturation factor 2 n=1 Tax=Plasmodium chabaudi chabaudi TaxID=31271 RepID=A0A1D3LDE5_PLACU|nr:lipase maturation factor, putative [Plasmodium chabaudi chabaudi]